MRDFVRSVAMAVALWTAIGLFSSLRMAGLF